MFQLFFSDSGGVEKSEKDIDTEKGLKRLSGAYAFIGKDNDSFSLYAYPKNLVALFFLDLLLARKCRKEKLSMKRKLFLRRSMFNGGNLMMLPVFVGIDGIEPHIKHTIYKDGNVYAEVSQYNGWLEFDYISREAREFVKQCHHILKELL